MNAVFFFTNPVKELAGLTPGKDAEKIQAVRKRVDKLITTFPPTYKQLMKDWTVKEVAFERMDGAGQGTIHIHVPPGDHTKPLPLLYWMHGGGLTTGSIMEQHGAKRVTALLARGVPVVWAAVAYRLAPEHVFPAAFNDCLSGLRHLVSSPQLASELGFDLKSVHLGGISSGGGLCASVARVVECGELGLDGFTLRSVTVLDPTMDPTGSFDSFVENAGTQINPPSWSRWNWDCYLSSLPGGRMAAPKDLRLCPHLHPPTPPAGRRLASYLVGCATGDILRDDGRAYAKAMREAGADVAFIEARGSHLFAWKFDTPKYEAFLEAWARLLQGGSHGTRADS